MILCHWCNVRVRLCEMTRQLRDGCPGSFQYRAKGNSLTSVITLEVCRDYLQMTFIMVQGFHGNFNPLLLSKHVFIIYLVL